MNKKQLENVRAVYYAATEELRKFGKLGLVDQLHESIGHELSEWEAWYDEGDPNCPPEFAPTIQELNEELAPMGLKGIGGRNPRVISL